MRCFVIKDVKTDAERNASRSINLPGRESAKIPLFLCAGHARPQLQVLALPAQQECGKASKTGVKHANKMIDLAIEATLLTTTNDFTFYNITWSMQDFAAWLRWFVPKDLALKSLAASLPVNRVGKGSAAACAHVAAFLE